MKVVFEIQNCNDSLWSKFWILFFFLNIEVVASQDTLSVQYSLNARGTFKEGQLNQTILSTDGYFSINEQDWKTELFANYKYLKTNGRIGENEFLGRVLISLFPKRNLFPVIGYIFNRSEFYQIRNRHIPGMGIGFKLLENKMSSMKIHAWAAYAHTDFENIPGYRTVRINTFLLGNHQIILDKLSLQYVFYYLQSVEQSNNYIWRIEPTLLFHLSETFSITINLESHYENIIDLSNTKRNSVLTFGVKFQNM